MNHYHLDYETRSRADLKKVGAYRYAEDDSTTILMAGISKNDGPVYLWVNPMFRFPGMMGDPEAQTLLEEAAADPFALWYAWNAQFEAAISKYNMAMDMGLNPPEPHQWRCVAAMSRRAAMPSKLETAAKSFNGPLKDKKGGALINTFCKPDKAGGFRDPTSPKLRDKFIMFGDYCRQDVVAEKFLHRKLRVFEFKDEPLRTFQLDSGLNDVGLPVNVVALNNAQLILDDVWAELSEAFFQLTGLMPTQKMAVKDLLQRLGVDIDDMKGESLKLAITAQEQNLVGAELDEDQDACHEFHHNLKVLRLYSDLNYAAAKKVTSMLACVSADSRVRGTLLYHGAGTGRWSGRLIQPQNFKRPTIKDTHLAYQMICEGCSRLELELVFGNPLEVIASCIRHFIHWLNGQLLDADYNAIEARIVCWLAGQEDVLQMFRDGTDLYKAMAGQIYNVSPDTVKNPSHERTVGKHTVLGCGFAMWWPKFQETCAKFGVTVSDELAERAVRGYRAMCDQVVQLWSDAELAAKTAINYPGKTYRAGKLLKFCVATAEGVPYLVMTLPSGRNIVYPHPKLEWHIYHAKDEKGRLLYESVMIDDIFNPGQKVASSVPKERKRQVITFYGQVEGKQLWERVSTYGGKLVEHATQGVAADIMAHGAVVARQRGFEVVTLIHDQALALAHPGHLIQDFVSALIEPPAWAAGLPIKAEGKVVPYYTKT